ncbi:MAG: hypothetical protein ACSHX6_16890 [Akkermansiaceae bacterium]
MKKLLINLLSFGLIHGVGFADPLNESPPKSLNWDTYEEVSRHASQLAHETLYFGVDWKSNLLDAQREAYKDDKPIVMILFFGDHRSNC